MRNTVLAVVATLAMSSTAYAVDGGAMLGGAIGGGAGAAIGSEMGGRNGAIIGGAIGGATGAAVGSQRTSSRPAPAPAPAPVRYRDDDSYNEHHDNGRHLGQRKHHHGRDD